MISFTESQKKFINGWELIEHNKDTDISSINEDIYNLVVNTSITKKEMLIILEILEQKSLTTELHTNWVVTPYEKYEELTNEMLFHVDSEFCLANLNDDDAISKNIYYLWMYDVVKFLEKALDEWFSSNKSIQPKGFKFVSQSKDANFEFIEIWYPNPEGPLDDLTWGMYTIAKAQRPEVMFGENKDKIYDLLNISETDMKDFQTIINKLS